MERGAWQAVVHGVTGVGSILATKPPHMEKMRQGTVYSCFIPIHFWLKLKALTDSFPTEKCCSFSCKMMISGNTMPRAEPSVSIKMNKENSQEEKPSWLKKKKKKGHFLSETSSGKKVCEIISWVTGYSVSSGAVSWCWKGDTHKAGQRYGWIPGVLGTPPTPTRVVSDLLNTCYLSLDGSTTGISGWAKQAYMWRSSCFTRAEIYKP